MKKAYIFLANGFEEVEALTVVDILRRAGVDIETVSITGEECVTSSHKVRVLADSKLDGNYEDADMLVLPGGMPGTNYLKESVKLDEILKYHCKKGTYLAAICAAPTVYGGKGMLEGKKACCYPGMEDGLLGAEKSFEPVVVSENFITSRGLGTAIDFGLKLAEILVGKDTSDKVGRAIVYLD